MPWLTYNSSKVYFEDKGNGQPVLLIHGWNSSSTFFNQAFVEGLERNFRVILIDLPGYGRSDCSELSFEKLSEIINSLLDKLQIERINILGFSMGTPIALDYSIRNPEKVNKVILIKPFVDYPFFLLPLMIPKLNSFSLDFFLSNRFGESLTKRLLLIKGFDYKNFYKMFSENDTAVSLEYMTLVWKYSFVDHYQRMSKLDNRMLIVLGESSEKYLINKAEKINKVLKKGTLVFIEKAKHFPTEENPSKTLAIIQKFINEYKC